MKQQTWEERFEEEFTVMDEDSGGNLQRVLFLDTGTFMESIDSEIKLKKFIQSELQRQREEIVEEIGGMKTELHDHCMSIGYGGRCYECKNGEFKNEIINDIIKKVGKV